MKRYGWMALLACAGMMFGAAGCSDDDSQQNNNNLNNTDGGVADSGTDADTPDGATPDAGPATGCTGTSPMNPQPMGACCNVNEDCIDGFCLSGYCTNAQCEEDADCEPTVAGPFPEGTPMTCNKLPFTGFIEVCVPGSAQPCGGASDSACPAGESCVIAWDETATNQSTDAMRGLCLTKMAGNSNLADGAQCDETADLYDYQCEAPGTILSSCLSRRCTTACDPDNATNTCPNGLECMGPLAFDVNGVLSGGGLCMGKRCGYVEATGDPDVDVQIPGIDSECGSGEVCVPSFTTGAAGDTLEFRCQPTVTGYGDPGDACEQAPKFGQFCNHGNLCLQQSPTFNAAGTPCEDDEDCTANEVCKEGSFGGRCVDKPDPGFCTKGCRTDDDCTNMGGVAYCTELSQDLPNGETGFLTACYPAAELLDASAVPCSDEGDCDADAGEGCLILSFHSQALFCGNSVDQDSTGVDCTTGGIGVCQAGQACVKNEDTGVSRCTDLLENGEACDPDADTCRNGWCVDSEFGTEDNSTPTNTFCSGVCQTTADCGPNQVCTNVLLAENDPAVDTDNVVVGLCQTQMVRSGTGCDASGTCTTATTGDTCNTTTHRCYDSGAAWGDPCAADYDCPDGGFCDTDVTGGMCYLPGCDPAVANSCGAGYTCSDENVVGVCLEECTTTANCSRQSDGFTCVNNACVAP